MKRASRTAGVAFAAVVSVLALGGCGSDEMPLEQVRVLRMNPAVVTKQPRRSTVVRASLTPARAPAVPALPPAMRVPDVGSIAVGATNHGKLVNGLQLPATGPDWVTYDPTLGVAPNRADRRWGTDRLLAFLLYVLRDYRLANPGAPPVVIGDLSRPTGGPFGSDYGGLGHVSHQNGLDADVYYPRLDHELKPPTEVGQVDLVRAQDLVDRFVAAGARFAFVGQHLGLRGPPQVVQVIPHHDDHVHARIADARL